MRTIKFRAWYKESKRFLENVQDLFNDKLNFPACFADILHDDNCVVEQYTGLKDKNGVEIYEGDIVEWYETYYWKPDLIGTVEFTDGAFMIVGNGHEKNKAGQIIVNNSAPLCEMDTLDVEILGNIHENSELLEAQHG